MIGRAITNQINPASLPRSDMKTKNTRCGMQFQNKTRHGSTAETL